MAWTTFTYNFNTITFYPTTVPSAPSGPWEIIGVDLAALPTKQPKVFQGNEEGYECRECNGFYPMAELNLPEGSEDCHSFACYGCRKGLITLFKKKV